MNRILLAFRVFFGVLFQQHVAQTVRRALIESTENGRASAGAPIAADPKGPPAKPQAPAAPKQPARSEALTLLAALQREARFVDFVQESLEGAADVQIGAVAREVHRGCREVVERMFGLEPVVTEPEGSPVVVPAGFDAGRFHLVGNVTGEPPFHGSVTHHGWQATRCSVPEWSGRGQSAHVVAPAEVELQ